MGRQVATCATPVVPPVMVLEKILFRTSQLELVDVLEIVKADVSTPVFGVPGRRPNRLTEL